MSELCTLRPPLYSMKPSVRNVLDVADLGGRAALHEEHDAAGQALGAGGL